MVVSRPPRAARQPQNRARVDSASDDDTEPEQEDTPKALGRSLSKKRLSERMSLGNDNSFNSDSGRGPLQSVNINDDLAEKRRRRKSAKPPAPDPNDNAEAGPSSEGAAGEQGAAESSEAARARQKQQLLSVAQAPAIDVPLDIMNSNFEEWMKMATDNKINAANSWNFALIDYFHEMSLLRNNGDGSINFQRASCTLDGCVKVWTSRVDSVGTETGKLLSNLANEGNADDEEEGAGSDNPDGQDPSQNQRKRKAHRPDSTLAKSAAQLRSKKLDLEFSVDPLFRKTCADFDEGGAQGLLMNHLNLGVGSEGSLRVVFDASDSMGKDGDDDEPLEEPEEEVDLSYLRSQFLPDLDVLDEKAISRSLEGFSFSQDALTFDDTTFFREDPGGVDDNDDDDDNDHDAFGGQEPMQNMEVDGDLGPAPVEDFFVGDQAVGEDYVGGDYNPQDEFGNDQGGEAAPGEQGRPGAFVPFDPRRLPNGRDFVMTDGEGADGSMMMDYFDQAFLKNWAGPEHWKLRKVVRRPDAPDAAAPKAKREKKEAFKIDFLSPLDKDTKSLAKELFAPVTRGTGITLPGPGAGKSSSKKGSKSKKAKDKEKRNDQTLPDDMHFSSRQLVTLFLKPKFSLKMRGRRSQGNAGADGEIDENFWAQAAANQAAGRADEDGDETANGGAIPFNTQFFHDDFDEGPGFDDVFDGGDVEASANSEPGEQDLLAATQGITRRVRPEFVNYAKRAKRVDVRKLKENIWKGLDIVVHEVPEGEEAEDRMDTDDRPPTDPAEPREFTSVISGLQKTYPREKLDDISTSFCFICLLHLANERGLKLANGAEDGEDVRMADDDQVVGNIWDLKVYRDPEATLAA